MTYVMPQQHWIVFDGRSLNDFNTYTSGEGTFSSPEKIYDTIEIPGRNGELTVEYGTYRNIEVVYPSFIPYDLRKYSSALRSFLGSRTGYCRLEDTRHPEEYRMARFVSAIEVNSAGLDVGSFELNFNCKPQRYLKTGEQKVSTNSSSYTIINPTFMNAKPIIIFHGPGGSSASGTLTINGNVIQISQVIENVAIDLETMFASRTTNGITQNMNQYIKEVTGSMEKMYLVPGSNVITKTGSITSIDIIPRWWTL